MRRRLTEMTCLFVAATATLSLTPAQAAVRRCGPGVTSDIAQADNELLGKRKALVSWSMKAARLGGPAFASWRVADKKVLGCKPGKTRSDGVQCIAYATPCAIVQAPGPSPQNPKGSPRTKRRLGGNVPFEI